MSRWQHPQQQEISLAQVIETNHQSLVAGESRLSFRKSSKALWAVGASLSVVLTVCAPGQTKPLPQGSLIAQAPKKEVEITLVSFAVTKTAHDRVIPKFVEKWKKEHNQTVTFKQSYGGSGSQARAVIDGLDADIVHLALAPDIKKIEKAGLIQPGWEKELPNNSIVSKSVAGIVTREGNPKGIKGFADLAKNGVSFITADPKSSGGARWNFLALWGSVIQEGGNEAKAKDFITKAYKNVPVLPKDAREASDVFFKQGQGDALLNYENELILAAQKGEKLPYIIPAVNISIDNPIAVVDKNVDKHGSREVSEAFVKYLFTPEAQREFAQVGFRPVDRTVAKEYGSKFPKLKTLATAQDFGGWDLIQKKFFADGGVFDQVQATIAKR
jgi:sulfate/thiosulfate transport system substrate-binding protein